MSSLVSDSQMNLIAKVTCKSNNTELATTNLYSLSFPFSLCLKLSPYQNILGYKNYNEIAKNGNIV